MLLLLLTSTASHFLQRLVIVACAYGISTGIGVFRGAGAIVC